MDSSCTALCWAAGLVTHRHELVIRNVSSHEEVSGSGLLLCVSSFLVLFTGYLRTGAPACRVVPPCFVLGTELSLCVCACMCVCVCVCVCMALNCVSACVHLHMFVCVLSPLSSASLPHKAVTQGQLCMYWG